MMLNPYVCICHSNINPNQAGVLESLTLKRREGGQMAHSPQQIQMIISPQPNVRLTSNQVVFLSLSFVLRYIKRK